MNEQTPMVLLSYEAFTKQQVSNRSCGDNNIIKYQAIFLFPLHFRKIIGVVLEKVAT